MKDQLSNIILNKIKKDVLFTGIDPIVYNTIERYINDISYEIIDNIEINKTKLKEVLHRAGRVKFTVDDRIIDSIADSVKEIIKIKEI